MSYDLLIRDADICDGTGGPRFHGSIGVRDGVIVEVGKISGSASRTINADGLVVAPDSSIFIRTMTRRSHGIRC